MKKQKEKTDLILEQAKRFAEDWTENKPENLINYYFGESSGLAIAEKKDKYKNN